MHPANHSGNSSISGFILDFRVCWNALRDSVNFQTLQEFFKVRISAREKLSRTAQNVRFNQSVIVTKLDLEADPRVTDLMAKQFIAFFVSAHELARTTRSDFKRSRVTGRPRAVLFLARTFATNVKLTFKPSLLHLGDIKALPHIKRKIRTSDPTAHAVDPICQCLQLGWAKLQTGRPEQIEMDCVVLGCRLATSQDVADNCTLIHNRRTCRVEVHTRRFSVIA